MTPFLVLLQGALLFVAPAAVVTLVGLAHRGRGDCRGERREIASELLLLVPWCYKTIQEERYIGIRRKESCLVEVFCLSSFPQLQLLARPKDQTLEKRDLHSYGRRKGTQGI